MAIEFNKANKLICVTSGQTTVTIQDLIDNIRDFEDSVSGIDVAQIANATGKQDLGGGSQVGITLELINDWRLCFSGWVPSDPAITVFVTGGNLVATNSFNNNPISSSDSPDTYATIQQSTSPSIVGVTSTEIADAVWDVSTSNYQTAGTTGKQQKDNLTVPKFLGLK